MNKGIIAALAAAGIVGAGAAIGLPLYQNYVESEVGRWLVSQGEAAGAQSVTFDAIEADVFAGTVSVRGYESVLEGFEIASGAAAGSVMSNRTTVEWIDARLDTSFFLTPVVGVLDGSAKKMTSVATTTLPDGTSQTATTQAEALEIANATLPQPGRPLDLDDPRAIAEYIRQGQADSATVRGLSIEADGLDAPVRIAEIEYRGLHGGRIDAFALRGLTFSTNKGGVDLGDLSFFNLDIAAILELSADADEGTPPTAAEVFERMGLDRIVAKDLRFDAPDGTAVQVGTLSVDEFRHFSGVPTGLRIEMEDARQTFAAGMIEQQIAEANLPVALNVPDTVQSRMSLRYDMDMDADLMSLAYEGADDFTDVTMILDIGLVGFAELIERKTRGEEVPKEAAMLTRLGNAKIVLDGGGAWETPGTVGGRPSPRLFAASYLANVGAGMPPVVQESVLAPVAEFLMRGGRLDLALAPDRPMGVADLQALQPLPPERQLRAIGLSVTHTPGE